MWDHGHEIGKLGVDLRKHRRESFDAGGPGDQEMKLCVHRAIPRELVLRIVHPFGKLNQSQIQLGGPALGSEFRDSRLDDQTVIENFNQ